MPVVDLSNMGLEGQQAFATRMATLAQADTMKASAEQTRLENIEKEREQIFSDAAMKMTNIAMGKNPSSGNLMENLDDDSAAAPMEKLSDLAVRFGAVESARKLANTASEIRSRESTIAQNEIENVNKRYENIIKGADVVARYLGTAKNQSEYDYGIDQLRKQGIMEPENIEALARMGWSQDLSAFLNEKAISAAEQARLDMQKQNLQSTESFRAASLARADRASRIAEARHRESVRHNKAIEKAGGKNAPSASAPSARDLESAKTVLKSTVFKGVDSGDVGAAAEYVASQARALVRQNTALTWDEAVQQTIIKAQQSGAFQIEEDEDVLSKLTGGIAGSKKKSGRFDGQGLSVETAVPMPKAKNEMKKGRYYITARGRAKWNGSAFELAE